MNRSSDADGRRAPFDGHDSVRRQITARTLDLAVVCLLTVAASIWLDGALHMFDEVVPTPAFLEPLMSQPVAVLWAVAEMPVIVLCGVAVLLRVMTRGLFDGLIAKPWRMVLSRRSEIDGR